MTDLSPSDRKVLAALTRHARAPVTQLAQELGLSRATVQASMERLVTERVIQRFTVEIDPAAGAEAIRAVTTIKVEGNLTSAVVRQLNRIPEVISLHSTNGAWDLVAQIEAVSLSDFDRVLRVCREIPGILSSETSILLSSAV